MATLFKLTPAHTCIIPVAVKNERGYVWEPDRNEKDDKEFITFIAQVEGLSAVPDGRIYMNAYIDTVKGKTKKTAVSGPRRIVERSTAFF